MADFRKLKVWQEAHALALAVCDVADGIRGTDYVSLRSQTIRAAASIDSNIVEGRGQRTDRQFIHYLNIAVNSANELESHFVMAHDRGIMRNSDYTTLLDRLVKTRKMLHGLINKLERKPKNDSQSDTPPEPTAGG
jgi:four helix bundle protein